MTNTKATSPKGTWDNFKHNVEQFVIRILIFIAAIIVGIIVIKLAVRAYRAAERAKLTAEIGELEGKLNIAKEFGRPSAGVGGAGGFAQGPAYAAQPQIVYVQAPPPPPQIVYAQAPVTAPLQGQVPQFAAP